MKNKLTPTHTLDWYVKWVGTIFLLTGMVLTSQNLFPYNLMFTVIGEICWFTVAFMWGDRALLVLTSVATFILASGLIQWSMS